MPTHRDYPWERDARAHDAGGVPGAHTRATSPAASATSSWRLGWTWQALIILAILVGALRLSGLQLNLADSGSSAPAGPAWATAVATPLPSAAGTVATPPPTSSPQHTAAAAPTAGWSVSSMHSRWASGSRALEVWGATDAATGASVRVALHGAPGVRGKAVLAPAASGRFYVKVHIPPRLFHQSLRIQARVTG
ncbi:MAG: hypothetical protein JWO02_2356 [Solirubrobacterales bacterium]|nr:hypothetical protein [Solirubrobacterales bacterium]